MISIHLVSTRAGKKAERPHRKHSILPMAYIGPTLVSLLAIGLLLSACETLPATSQEIPLSTTPTASSPTTLTAPSPTGTPSHRLPQSDEVVLSITNSQPFSGREGNPVPEWPGWGAESLAVAPDGSYWLADSYVEPPRLLHYSPSGEQLESIPLEQKVVYVYDLLVLDDSLWLLDISSQLPKIVQLSLDGEVLRSLDLPENLFLMEGNPIFNGVLNLQAGESGEILANTVNGAYELLDSSGNPTYRPLEGISWAGHTYRVTTDPISFTLSLSIDGNTLPIAPPEYIDSPPFIGFNPDGSVAIAIRRETPVQSDVPAVQIDPLVAYYAPSGELLSVARRWPTFIYVDMHHDLAFGSDGMVYQFVTNPNHSVQVVRLGSAPEYAALPRAPEVFNSPVPTVASPRLPLWETPPAGATEQEIARESLVRFFTQLDQKRYTEAAALYGGDFSEVNFERLPGEEVGAYWERLCSAYTICMPVLAIPQEEKISEEEFRFYVEFLWLDGTRFVNGPCCGASPAQQPGYWQFAYSVKKVDDQWKVMRAPLYIG